MQIQKEEIKQAILASAETEFLEKSFEKASLRVIAKNANVTKGSIYIYFKNKDALFVELIKPAMNFFYEVMNKKVCNECIEEIIVKAGSLEYHNQESIRHAKIVLKNYNSFKLLFFCSAGSSMENFREEIRQLYSKQSHYYYMLLGRHKPELKTHVSKMFIHTLASCYLSMIEELILHKPRGKKLTEYIEQISAFVYLGTNEMLLYQNKKIKKDGAQKNKKE